MDHTELMENQKYLKGVQALELLASVVSVLEENKKSVKSNYTPDHRVSCHRCGNIRKRKVVCVVSDCPHIFCGRCCDKMKEEHGKSVFVNGCPVCKYLCCCSNKSVCCNRLNHCYRKCPASKTARAPVYLIPNNHGEVFDDQEAAESEEGEQLENDNVEEIEESVPKRVRASPLDIELLGHDEAASLSFAPSFELHPISSVDK